MRNPSLTDLRVFLVATLTVFLLAAWPGTPLAVWAAEVELEQELAVPDTAAGKDTYPGAGEPVPRSRRPIREFFEGVKVDLQDADPFFRDTDLNLHLRTYYLGKWNTNSTTQQSWAGGGWLEYKSGWWKDTVQLGGTVFTTFPIYAPAGEGGTGLLTPDQDGFIVAGIAYGALRYKEYAALTGFRQFVDTPYINRQDNRMVPRTNEAVTVGGKLGFVEYLAGYLWSQKPRDTSDFRSFSTIAGVPDKERGAILGNLRIAPPIEGLTFTVHDSYVPDLFNTFYADAGYRLPLTQDLTLGLGAQYTDQRAVGQDLLAVSTFNEWVNYVASARLALTWKGLTLEGAVSRTGPGANIQNPYGSYPGYISQLFNDFDRANEFAWLVGLTYDFRGVALPGFTANLEYSQGNNAIDPVTRADVPNEKELNLNLAYAIQEGTLRGLRFDAKGGILDYTNSGRTGYQLRLILNYEFNLL